MIGAYYDVETYPNFLSLLFLDITTSQHLIDAYVDADIKKDLVRKKEILGQINYKLFIVYTKKGTNQVTINNILEFYSFIKSIKILIGFNSVKFDNLIVDHLLIHEEQYSNPINDWQINLNIYSLVESIIANNNSNYKYIDTELNAFQEPFRSMDLYTGLLESVDRKSLKQIGIILKWYRIEDLPIKAGSLISEDQITPISDYNFNDVLLTRLLHIKHLDEINLKLDVGDEYNLDLLSANRSKIAEKLLTKFYSEATGMRPYQFRDKRTFRNHVKFGDIINPKVTFTTPIFKELHDRLMKTTYLIDFNDSGNNSKFGETVIFKNKGYTLGVGGLHSVDYPYLYTADPDKLILRDADVTSYYPNLVLNEGVCPAHIAPVAFSSIVNMIVHKRTEAKHLAKKYKDIDKLLYKKNITAADALKIVANSGLFGFFGSADKWLYDIKCTYQTTLNGQLYLLMLIEQLEESGIEVISANTDGIVSRFKPNLESTYNQICANWQNMTNLSLEYTNYYKYVRTSVNDYIAIKPSFLQTGNRDDIKLKGDFISTPTIKKGFNAPIVAKALELYYVDGVPVEQTIENHRDIYDFCIGVKTGESFVKSLLSLKDNALCIEDLSKNLRYYVSTNGKTLIKSSDTLTSNMLKNYLVTPFNDYYPVEDFNSYKLNYRYYIRRANDIMLKVQGVYDKPRTSRRVSNRTSKGSKFTGRLFDEI